MPTSNSFQTSLADIRATNLKNKKFSDTKRKRIDNAFKSMWRYTGRRLDQIPATMPALREVIGSIEPAAHGIKRPTILNMRGYVMHAMAQSGLVPELSTYKQRRKPLSPSWTIFRSRLDTHFEKNAFWSFVNFMNGLNVEPSAVTDDLCKAFSKNMTETSPRSGQYQLVRTATRYWNSIGLRFPDLKLQELQVPPSRLRRLPFSMADFPMSFQADADRYFEWAGGDDVFDANARDRKLSKSTIALHRQRIHRVACIAVKEGIHIESITGLDALVTSDNFKKILRGLLSADKSAGRSETFQAATILIQVARDWLRYDIAYLNELSRLKGKLPKPKMEMTEKNKQLVSQFDDPDVLHRLVKAPSMIWVRVRKDDLGGRSRLALAQAAISIGILVAMPLRLNNLTKLEFGQNIVLRPGGVSSLLIAADDTKTGRAIEFDIPQELAEMLREYRDEIVPPIVEKSVTRVFCRTDGVAKGFAQVRYLIQTYFKQYVGFHMNPHAFRHLSAKIILDADPGAHVVVQELLGHKSVETATAFYAGLNSRRAGRHHQQLMLEAMAREQPSPIRRRAKKSGR